MSAYFNSIKEYFLSFVSSHGLFLFSSLCFAICFIAGTVSLLLLFFVRKLRGKSFRWYSYVCGIFFLQNVCLSLSEREIFGNYFTSVSSAYMFSLIEYVALMVLYALICVFNSSYKKKNSLDKNKIEDNSFLKEKDNTLDDFILEFKDEGIKLQRRDEVISPIKNGYYCSFCNEKDKKIEKNEKKEYNPVVEEQIPMFSASILHKILSKNRADENCDINIPYIQSILLALKSKNLTAEDRQFVEDLQFNLKKPPCRGSEEVIKLNEDFCKLIKKMCEYNISA